MSTASIQFIKGNGDDHNILEQFSLITDVTRKEKINNKITTTTAQLILDNLVCDLIAVSCVLSIKSVLNERSNACVECLIITIQNARMRWSFSFIYYIYFWIFAQTNFHVRQFSPSSSNKLHEHWASCTENQCIVCTAWSIKQCSLVSCLIIVTRIHT